MDTSTDRRRLDSGQSLRCRTALNDLAQAQQLDCTTATAPDLLFLIGALTSSLYTVLQIVEDLAEVER